MRILIVAEAPGKEEDLRNTQLIGPAGQLLRDALAEFGIDLDRDCRKTNSCRCRPPENRRPTNQEIIACQPHIWDEIKERPPKLILLLGQVAVESFLSGRVKSPGQIGRWRGFVIPDQKAQAWVCPVWHPSFILRSREGRMIRGKTEPVLPMEERIFMEDLNHALRYLKKTFPIAPVPVVCTPSDSDFLRWKKTPTVIATDYETTGLKPYQKGHKIISCGVCWGEEATSFPMTTETVQKWKKILIDPTIKKLFHNCKFECQWSLRCLGVETKGVLWDTMLASHLLDNRRGICGLKHQIYLNFGVENWGSGIAFSEDENGFNSSEPTEELLHYNLLDAFWTYQLAQVQMKQFSK